MDKQKVTYDYENVSNYQWFEVEDRITTLYANFQEYDPNEEIIEINVRANVFRPLKHILII